MVVHQFSVLKTVGSVILTLFMIVILAFLVLLAFSISQQMITFGNTISVILDFIIIAFAVFCLVKGINALHRKKEEAPAAPPAPPEPSAEEKLLTEIRDLLKK